MTDAPEDPYDVNRAWWDECAGFHLETPFYQRYVQKLMAGGHCLLPLEVGELGDVKGLDVLHLQCHVGPDTLSLARLGAQVTGVDFSPVAIREATGLADRLGIEANFVQSEVGDLGGRFPQRFDLVFTGYGALSWLSDLTEWAENIAATLRPGGRLYVVEMHPLAYALDEEWTPESGPLRVRYPYLAQESPLEFDDDGTYADRERLMKNRSTREWPRGLGDVVTAVQSAGLNLVFLREHAVGFCPIVQDMEPDDDGHYRLPPELHGAYPMTFSLMATLAHP
ncbi:MAG: class I SAM-dependent methyltransferase [Myxococcota bacterium]|nr:class I SAM-dependent methyltransferase [Myxococcota bacterium]